MIFKLNYIFIAILLICTAMFVFNSGFSEEGHDDHKHDEKKDDHSEDTSKKEKSHEHGNDHEEASDKHSDSKSKHDHKDNEKEEEHAHNESGEGHEENEHGHDEKEKGHGHEEDGHGEEGSKFGPGKAILASENDGARFKLADEARKLIGITIASITQIGDSPTFEVPKTSIVEYQENYGVFVERDGWFHLIKVSVDSKATNFFKVSSKKIKKTDTVVNSGLGLLRAAHLEASGQGGKGHAH